MPVISVTDYGIVTWTCFRHTFCMITLGITTAGNKLLLNQQGQIIQSDQKPNRIILGLGVEHIRAKRIWLDADLTDEQKIIFLKRHFGECSDMIIDYDCIKQDQNRELLHVYGVSRRMLQEYLQRYQLKGKNLFVETSLHGLGRALVERYGLGAALFHCLSFFDDHVLFSSHMQEVLLYYQQEPLHNSHDVVCAARRALLRYQCDEDYRECDRFIYAHFTNSHVADVTTAHISVSYDDCQTLIPYGLALRGKP